MKANEQYDQALRRAVIILAALAAVLVIPLLFSVSVNAEVIHEERSLYRDITVVQNGPRRCLIFNIHIGDRNQTCVDVNEPEKLVFSYTRMSFAGLLVNPEPERILVAGLGGGSIPMTLTELFPSAQIDVVEIDPAVFSVAKEFFFFEESDRMEVTVADARVFVKRAGIQGRQYDYIVLDAFTGDYIPEHLLTREFLQEVQEILAPGGVLVANTFSTSRFYDHESVTYQSVYGEFFNFKLPYSGNRIIITGEQPLPERGELITRAQGLSDRLQKYDIPILEYPARLSTAVDWDMSRRVLTDQFSPANLLRDN
ncbi:MAG: fused MFS/spermidine synthase [Gammaproteobacteria bacterium]|nr:fused MFS/spermidine synthase [Gammaproteobacteria bacterium]